MKINRNTLARDVALKEGGRLNLSIAQIKEVQRLTLEDLADKYKTSEVVELLEKVRER